MNSQSNIRVAVLDDHPTLRRGLISVLTEHNIEVVIEAGNGKEFINMLEDRAILPEICILDIQMPIMNGYETTEYLRKHYPTIKILVYSLYEHEYNIITLLKKGAVGYLNKSCEISEIIEALLAIKKNGFFHSRSVAQKASEILYHNNTLNLEFNTKELEFISLCCSDLYYDEIAKAMNVSRRTVDGYRDSCYSKLGIKSRAALVLFAIQAGIVTFNN